MTDPPATNPGHWVQCPECQRFFENEQGRGSHRLHAHGIRANGQAWFPASPAVVAPTEVPPAPSLPAPPPALPTPQRHVPSPEPTRPAPPAEPTPPPQPVEAVVVDWSDPKNASAGLSTIAQSLAHTPPPPNLGPVGRFVMLVVILTASGFAIYFMAQQLKRANKPAPAYTIQATQRQKVVPAWTTGDPYWDSVLGYRGLRL